MNNKKMLIASKRLNKNKISFSDESMSFSSCWFRFAFNETSFNHSLHHHNFYELHYSLSGTSDFYINNIPVTLSKNYFLLIPPNNKHRIVNQSDDFIKIVLAFEVEFKDINKKENIYLSDSFSKTEHQHLYASSESMKVLSDLLAFYTYENKPLTSIQIESIIKLLLCEIAIQINPKSKPIATENPNNNNNKNKSANNIWTNKIVQYINDNISSKITCRKLSEQFHISVQQLNRNIIFETGNTTSEIIADTKYKAICILLETTDLTLQQIAVSVGFSNEYNLNRFFKLKSGMPPGKYRLSVNK